jgi:hypothetical protein
VLLGNETNVQCGTGGAACAACSGGQVCQAGACQTPACAGCQPYQCCANAACTNAGNAACGANGVACVNCNTPSQYCGWNTDACVTLTTQAGSSVLGSPCAGDQDCGPAPNSGNEPDCFPGWPGGYCTEPCDNDPNNFVSCSNPAARCLGSTIGICLSPCDSSLPCAQSTYVCDGDPAFYNPNYNSGSCVPSCNSANDCLNFFGVTGVGCNTANHQCCGAQYLQCCAGNTCPSSGTCSSGQCQ